MKSYAGLYADMGLPGSTSGKTGYIIRRKSRKKYNKIWKENNRLEKYSFSSQKRSVLSKTSKMHLLSVLGDEVHSQKKVVSELPVLTITGHE